MNLAGIRQMAWFQNVTVVLKFLPLLFVGTVGWFFVSSGNFGAFNASGGSLYSAIGIAAGIALFSFIGVETAAINARRVRDPGRNVGRAYRYRGQRHRLPARLGGGDGPGSAPRPGGQRRAVRQCLRDDLQSRRLGRETGGGRGHNLRHWRAERVDAGDHRGVQAPANDDLFPRAFAWTDRHDNAWFGIIIAALLPSLLMLRRYTTSTGLTVFTYLVALTVVTVAFPYLFSALAQLSYLVSGRRRVQGWLLARDLFIAGAAALFSLWVTCASGYQAVYQAMVLVLIGLMAYPFLKARRERLGEAPVPHDLPTQDSAAALPQPGMLLSAGSGTHPTTGAASGSTGPHNGPPLKEGQKETSSRHDGQ